MTKEESQLLYEGKAKKVFSYIKPDMVLVEFKNDATAFNARKRQQLIGKGTINCQISARLFEYLEANHIPTHYCGLISDDHMLARKVKVIPLEVVVRNIAYGSLCRETPISLGQVLEDPLIDL